MGALDNLLVRNIPDLSWGLETPMPMFVVSTFSLLHGRKSEWLNYEREDLVPALRQSGLATYVVQESVYGGDTSVVCTLARFDLFADVDSIPLRQLLGEEAYATLIAKRPAGAVVRVTRFLARHRRDLSIIPEATAKPSE